MHQPHLEIVVRGHANTGKSSILYAIKQFLEFNHGIDIEYTGGEPEYNSYRELQDNVNPTIEERLDAIGEKTQNGNLKITIRSEQLNRSGFQEDDNNVDAIR
jgi:hypothetical protein